MSVKYHVFHGTLASRAELFEEASEFATSVGHDRLINISHFCDHSNGVVTSTAFCNPQGPHGTF